ncbi:TPA: chloride channel protein [Burkholderia cenocepacia]|uniref:chloride channel protein n=1 Tax=unclassified Burkholderia TaxID=2613784 RepID=UPI0015884D1C|nr:MULTISPECIES: chloride channel protein [unclassified Burkholderia]HEF5869798.1 chloride channel protein [Burkholderia cenocepacia]
MRPDLPSAPASSSPTASPFARMAVVTVLTGIGAGLGGMLLALLLHAIQHVAYGYSLSHVIGSESFLSGVTAAEPLRRFAVLVVCGIVAGGGWWALYRYGRPLVSIRRAVRAADPRMPFVSTTIHALLQIVTVALGSPLGREVAPREIGSLLAGRLAHAARLTPDDCRLMVACGAGAGLAAVYNVPLGGAIFVLEVLLGTFELRALIVAVVTSAIAAIVAWLGLGNEHQYTVPAFVPSTPLVAWSIVCGPLFGFAAYGFVRLTTRARASAPKDGRLPVFAVLNFAVIGVLAMRFPQLLGNGKGPASLGFDGTLTIGLAAVLLALKVLIEAGSLRAGAEGGLLTPGLANGALLGVVLGGLWSVAWPGASLGGCALIGATAFLAASMQMPITAVVLMLEFTRANHDSLVPMLLAVAGSLVAYRFAQRLAERRESEVATVSTSATTVR